MLKSSVRLEGRKPVLCVEGIPTPAMAYTTYFEERSRYLDFLQAGYRIFFVNATFTTLPINSFKTGFTPFRVGVFEDPENPDYSEFEDAVHKILAACPDAVIFPRIYVSMPRWWIAAHPEETVLTKKGGRREILFSSAFRKDGAELLRRFVRHVKASDYAPRVAGWQLCGGQTQEWFHPDMKGCLADGAAEPYRRWVNQTYGEEGATLPDPSVFEYSGQVRQTDENARRYSLFCNLGVAESLEHFAATVKEETEGAQIVGSFYGYSFECNRSVLFGSHGLRRLLDSPYLDFFSSPNAYTANRAFGIDWADMMPVDSLRHHGKLAFMECDIRTFLTTGIQQARPGEYPDDIYQTKNGTSVWSGPPTELLSRSALRKCFAHQITKASAVWWFDMWGGWYHNSVLMDELARMKQIYDGDLSRNPSVLEPELIFFADECAYANLFSNSPQLGSHYEIGGVIASRTAMGTTGIPFDTYAVEDAPSVLSRYKAAVFPFPVPSDTGKKAMELCDSLGIPYLTATEEHYVLTTSEIRAFCLENGLHAYAEEGDVVYVGNGYLGLHSTRGGEREVKLPRSLTANTVYGTSAQSGTVQTLRFPLEENETALFRIEE